MPAPFETSFAGALLDAEQPVPHGITAYNAAIPARRFAVHRNNVVAGWVKALKSRFPVVEKIVGEEFFAAMARAYVVEPPPRSPLLFMRAVRVRQRAFFHPAGGPDDPRSQ
jgi:hypothetical protein